MVDVKESWATFSPCRTYRYTLGRRWGDGDFAMFIGLNPSTADETKNDPTVRRCIRFAQSWGYGAMFMTNIFAFRSTDPKGLLTIEDPIGPGNNEALLECFEKSGVAVAAWGVHGELNERNLEVRKLLNPLHYLRLTKAGHPGHPLYLPKTLTPQPWILDD